MKRDIALSLSLANLLFVFAWGNLVYPMSELLFGTRHFRAGNLAMIIAVFATAAMLLIYRRAIRKWTGPKWREILLGMSLVLLLFPLNYYRVLLNLAVKFHFLSFQFWYRHSLIFAFGVCALGWGLWRVDKTRLGRVLGRLEGAFLSIAFPLAILTLSQSLLSLARYAMTQEAAGLHMESKKELNPVIVLLFDELSWNAIDPRTRSEFLKGRLPAFDRLVSESFVSHQVTSPGLRTMDVIPRYFGGRNKLESMEHFSLGTANVFSMMGPEESVFELLLRQGARSAVVGWFYPYCAVYGAFLESCSKVGGASYHFTSSILDNLKYLADRSVQLAGGTHDRHYLKVRERAHERIVRFDWDLLVTHWPIPHLPQSFEPEGGGMISTQDESRMGYLKNVLLVDHTLNEIRSLLEVQGLWDRMTLVLMSDHAVHDYRDWAAASPMSIDRRVPFVIHFPGQRHRVDFNEPFSLGILHSTLQKLVFEKDISPESLSEWLRLERKNALASAKVFSAMSREFLWVSSDK